MKIAILSDIHGNADALKAVLEEANKLNISEYFVLGDYVGYYYEPDLVLKLLSEINALMIKGNHEEILNGLKNKNIDAETIKHKYGSGHEIALKILSSKTIETLNALPDQITLQRGKYSILLSHGAAFDNKTYLYPDSEETLFENCDSINNNFVFYGHSHYQFFRKSTNSLLINPGSVGQSRDSGGLARWCILNTISGTVVMKSTSYAKENLLRQIEKYDPENTYLKNILFRNS